MEEIVIELLNTIKWIPEKERQSKWYNEYLDKVNQDLKKRKQTKIITNKLIMKTGDYIRAKESFFRIIYSVKRNNNTGEIITIEETGTINFTQNKKYLITNITTQFNEELIEIQADNNHLVCFSSNNIEGYEQVNNLFTEDIATTRKEKIIQLNKIAKKQKLINKLFGATP